MSLRMANPLSSVSPDQNNIYPFQQILVPGEMHAHIHVLSTGTLTSPYFRSSTTYLSAASILVITQYVMSVACTLLPDCTII